MQFTVITLNHTNYKLRCNYKAMLELEAQFKMGIMDILANSDTHFKSMQNLEKYLYALLLSEHELALNEVQALFALELEDNALSNYKKICEAIESELVRALKLNDDSSQPSSAGSKKKKDV